MWTNLDTSKVIASMSENFSSYFEILMCAIYANTDDNMHMNRICRSGMTITLNSRISAHSTNWMNTWAPSLKGWASPLPEPENDINVTPQSNRFYKLWHQSRISPCLVHWLISVVIASMSENFSAFFSCVWYTFASTEHNIHIHSVRRSVMSTSSLLQEILAYSSNRVWTDLWHDFLQRLEDFLESLIWVHLQPTWFPPSQKLIQTYHKLGIN